MNGRRIAAASHHRRIGQETGIVHARMVINTSEYMVFGIVGSRLLHRPINGIRGNFTCATHQLDLARRFDQAFAMNEHRRYFDADSSGIGCDSDGGRCIDQLRRLLIVPNHKVFLTLHVSGAKLVGEQEEKKKKKRFLTQFGSAMEHSIDVQMYLSKNARISFDA